MPVGTPKLGVPTVQRKYRQTMLFHNKYRIESSRLRNWDYSSSGAYFITICTQNRIQYFGKINKGKMLLSETGKIADKYWREIPNHFTNTRLDEYIIMPNHIHGIIKIDHGDPIIPLVPTVAPMVETPESGVSTKTVTKKPTLGIIINQFKRICTLTTHKKDIPFAWQSRFYDHIIRDDISLHKIREYIKNNTINWDSDEENPTSKSPLYVAMLNPQKAYL